MSKRDWKREEFAHAMVDVGGCPPWKMVDYERSRALGEYGTRWRIVVPNVVEVKKKGNMREIRDIPCARCQGNHKMLKFSRIFSTGMS